jgi:hypothetical protein
VQHYTRTNLTDHSRTQKRDLRRYQVLQHPARCSRVREPALGTKQSTRKTMWHPRGNGSASGPSNRIEGALRQGAGADRVEQDPIPQCQPGAAPVQPRRLRALRRLLLRLQPLLQVQAFNVDWHHPQVGVSLHSQASVRHALRKVGHVALRQPGDHSPFSRRACSR